mmetsp:Transcript_1246/g.1293  ORF Transcript_1246/g.1293 Transcript_1246/m.1293 type:complete len:147 (+) Transcript_1246:54-494(+)|eukprot:gene11249-12256_t
MSVVYALRNVRLNVPAGSAKPGPALGQALGPLGLNMAEFCKQFNDRTKNYEKDVPIPVILTAMSNRSFTFYCKTPTTSYLLFKCAGIKKGSETAVHKMVGKVHVKQIYEIAKIKQRDEHLAKIPLETLCRIIVGSCRSAGLEVVKD